jgi:tetratricopeptide (TPR) repeat protein
VRPVHYISLAAAIILIALLYWGGNTVPPRGKNETAMQRPSSAGGEAPDPGTMKPASVDSIISVSKQQLPRAVADTVSTIENELAAVRDSSQMAAVFTRLADVWQRHKQFRPAFYYRAKAAKLENSEKSLTFAGQLFLELLEREGDRSLQMWEANEAVAVLEKAVALNGNNEEAKLAMASAYIQGTPEPMKGVQMLLAITREKPEDVPANLLLGRMSIQSGQFDKAVKRFETVVKVEPENKEALYFLAQAYEGMGNKPKAIELLERCKKVVNNPEFTKDIDAHINSLK